MKLVIIGAGKMGRWFALHFQKKGIDVSIQDIDSERAAEAAKACSVKHAKGTKEIFIADAVLVAASLDKTPEVVEEIGKKLKENQILIEIASLKSNVVPKLKTLNCKTLSIHPMFGPSAESIERQNIIVIKEASSSSAKEKILPMLNGANISELDAQEHDEIMAIMHSLPYAMNMAFWETVKSKVPDKRFWGTRFPEQLEIARKIADENEDLKNSLIGNPKAKKILAEYTKRIMEMAKSDK